MGWVGQLAPQFETKAVIQGRIEERCSLENFKGQYVLLFFYPLDFTFVCPTELHAFQEQLPAFEARGVQVMGCSVDSAFSHAAWQQIPRSSGGIAGIEYPLLADLTKSIARAYGVLNEKEGIAYRGLFLIDTSGIIRHMLINDLPLGRSVDEALRIIDALLFFEAHGEVCPANWQAGKKAMKATRESLNEYFNAVVRQ